VTTANLNPTTFPLSLLTPSFADGVMDNDILNIIIAALNQIAAESGRNIRVVPTSPSPQAVLGSDGILLCGTVGANLTLTAPIHPTTGQVLTIIDELGNCSAHPIAWVGTVSGVTNPTLIDTNWASSQLLYTGAAWLRLR
jgi:hypothetical protein